MIEKSINDWCPHFSEFGSSLKTKAKKHLDCTDCSLNSYDCPYKDENYNQPLQPITKSSGNTKAVHSGWTKSLYGRNL